MVLFSLCESHFYKCTFANIKLPVFPLRGQVDVYIVINVLYSAFRTEMGKVLS